MRVTVNDTELYFDVEGAGLVPDGPTMRQRPTVLLLHGGPGFDHTGYKPFLSPLADAAQLVYLDQRGQGRSARVPVETCTAEQMADDAAALCHALGLVRPVVLGMSFGGFVALHLALRHPDVVGGLVLADTAAASDDTVPDEAMDVLERRYGAETRAKIERFFDGDVSEAASEGFWRLVLPTYVNRAAEAADVADVLARARFSHEVAAYHFGHRAGTHDVRARLHEIRVPTLVLVGEEDWVTPPRASRVLAAGIPGAQLEVIPDAGHLVFVDQPERFNAAVRRLLSRKEITMATTATAKATADEHTYDYTKPGHYPRSGREQLGGIAFLPRAIDKMRAHIDGTAGEYVAAAGMSALVFELFGVTPERFEEAVRHNATDEGVLRWLHEHGATAPTPAGIERSNQLVLNLSPAEAAWPQIRAELERIGAGHRTDIRTLIDLQDLEEGREVPRRDELVAAGASGRSAA